MNKTIFILSVIKFILLRICSGIYLRKYGPSRWNPLWRGDGAYLIKKFQPVNKKSSSEQCY